MIFAFGYLDAKMVSCFNEPSFDWQLTCLLLSRYNLGGCFFISCAYFCFGIFYKDSF